jgi:hypothetical protein
LAFEILFTAIFFIVYVYYFWRCMYVLHLEFDISIVVCRFIIVFNSYMFTFTFCKVTPTHSKLYFVQEVNSYIFFFSSRIFLIFFFLRLGFFLYARGINWIRIPITPKCLAIFKFTKYNYNVYTYTLVYWHVLCICMYTFALVYMYFIPNKT